MIRLALKNIVHQLEKRKNLLLNGIFYMEYFIREYSPLINIDLPTENTKVKII